jgi:hypothetical protein
MALEQSAPPASEYCRRAANEVLTAKDRDDVAERLDVLAGDEKFWEEFSKYLAEARERKPSSPADKTEIERPTLTAVLGPAAAERLVTAYEAFKKMVDVGSVLAKQMAALASEMKARKGEGKKNSEEPYSIVDVLYDRSLPHALRREVGGIFHSIVAMFVIGDAEKAAKKLPVWLADALVDLFAETPLRLTALFDALPTDKAEFIAKGLEISSMLARDAAERKELDAVAEEWRRAATASHDGVFFPLGDGDGEAR